MKRFSIALMTTAVVVASLHHVAAAQEAVRSGQVKRFKFPIRTTEEGTAEPLGGFNTDPGLEGPVLYTEPDSLGTDVWTK